MIMKPFGKSLRTLLVASALASLSLGAFAETITLRANLKGSSEVPPTTSAGHGRLTATLDTTTNELTYHITFAGMTGPVVAAHFHGPAEEGKNAGPQVPIPGKIITSPINGKATLNADQEKQLLDGMWYFNLHTAQNPGGEIRGQLSRAK